MHFCQFCTKANCKDCMTKTRPFPKAKLDNQGHKPRGKICKYCDRKFLVRAMLLEKHAIVQKVKDLEHSVQVELDEQAAKMQ